MSNEPTPTISTSADPSPELQAIAALAPTLKEAEIRVLLELARRGRSVSASSRDLSAACNTARSNVQPAIDRLAERGIISVTPGTSTRPATYRLRLFDCVQIQPAGVALLQGHPPAIAGEEVALLQGQGGPVSGPPSTLFDDQVALLQGQGGPVTGPPPYRNKELPDPAGAVDISISTSILDRLLRANPKRIDPDRLAAARRFLHGYTAKLGREPHAHPPDDRITAQFLAIAEWPRLEKLLYDLLAERKEPGYSYAWFVTVALQRIHGIQPAALQQRRAELRLVKGQHAGNTPPQRQEGAQEAAAPAEGVRSQETAAAEPDPGFTEDLVRRAMEPIAANGRRMAGAR